ncbi:hypothetical protein O181_077109 [Austropuccinia psidii MF-1]|uniref:Uncharacterized protein n=1 Tax=Austropuccinia psidii MF-1 TaxID=1389203 RepID=A0A9Q3FEB5_9BASI|nr:hypothetical protein [Austropuccinia psidii MF-1]
MEFNCNIIDLKCNHQHRPACFRPYIAFPVHSGRNSTALLPLRITTARMSMKQSVHTYVHNQFHIIDKTLAQPDELYITMNLESIPAFDQMTLVPCLLPPSINPIRYNSWLHSNS